MEYLSVKGYDKMELEEQKKHQISKILIALLIIIVILFIILKIVDLKNNSKYEKYKLDKTKEYVYTKYTSTKNNAKVPFINIKKEVSIGISEFDTLNPITTQSLEMQYISKLIYKSLVEITQSK